MEGEIFVSVTYFYYLCTCMWYTKGEREKGGRGERDVVQGCVWVHKVWERERGRRH